MCGAVVAGKLLLRPLFPRREIFKEAKKDFMDERDAQGGAARADARASGDEFGQKIFCPYTIYEK
jgi:hypothetical protein